MCIPDSIAIPTTAGYMMSYGYGQPGSFAFFGTELPEVSPDTGKPKVRTTTSRASGRAASRGGLPEKRASNPPSSSSREHAGLVRNTESHIPTWPLLVFKLLGGILVVG